MWNKTTTQLKLLLDVFHNALPGGRGVYESTTSISTSSWESSNSHSREWEYLRKILVLPLLNLRATVPNCHYRSCLFRKICKFPGEREREIRDRESRWSFIYLSFTLHFPNLGQVPNTHDSQLGDFWADFSPIWIQPGFNLKLPQGIQIEDLRLVNLESPFPEPPPLKQPLHHPNNWIIWVHHRHHHHSRLIIIYTHLLNYYYYYY